MIARIALLLGLIITGVSIVAFGFRAEERQLSAPGLVVVERKALEVHSNVNGTIAEVRVRGGDHVAAGDVLMRLDETGLAARALGLLRSQDELSSRLARLRAELNKAKKISFPSSLTERGLDPRVTELLDGETALFNARQAIKEAQTIELLNRVARLEKEIGAYGIQVAAKSGELALVNVQLQAARDLRAKRLIPSATLAGLEREAIRLAGERDGVLGASIAQAEGRISEIRFMMIQVDRDREADIMRDLRDTETKLADVSDRQRGTTEQLKLLEVTAPEAGVVEYPAARSVGAAVAAGQELVSIAPPIDGFAIDASIAQSEIAAVRLGQSVTVQLPVAGSHERAQLSGILRQIAPIDGDGTASQQLYRARIDLAATDCSKVGPVQPGTEARVMLGVHRRSVLSSVLQPVGHGIARALGQI
jgi:HlyD family secretion protein